MDAIDVARAVLRRAETKVGVRESAPPIDVVDEQPGPISELLPGGTLPAGAASVITGSTSLLLTALATSQRSDQWVGVVGMPDLGYLAAASAGIALERVAVVPDVDGQGALVVAALLDGVSYVVVGPRVRLTVAERRQLLARARERGSALVSTTAWEGAALGLEVTAHRWSGPELGRSLRQHEVEVERTAAGVPARFTVVLPTPDSPLVPAIIGEVRRAQGSGLRLVG